MEKKEASPNEFVANLKITAQDVIARKPYLLQAFVDYMDINYKEIDPILQNTWEHSAMWLLHHQFMLKADVLKIRSPAYSKELDELINIMKLLAQIIDLQLLPITHREAVEEWAGRYKAYFLKTP